MNLRYLGKIYRSRRSIFVPTSIARTDPCLPREWSARVGRHGKEVWGGKVGMVRCVIMPYLADLINPCA